MIPIMYKVLKVSDREYFRVEKRQTRLKSSMKVIDWKKNYISQVTTFPTSWWRLGITLLSTEGIEKYQRFEKEIWNE